ncbi:sterol O-acyltransferase 1-like isoform X2 [Brachionus plicatilis]|uniref:O-acyltransferase n=1 Tax=Brachionus plicatilis TaxID=10195 RepID=A0A3M7T120_BRAPC|nr:sterol O-acyltransferase 1-like isoform X2 [Brachionus plicatilis]
MNENLDSRQETSHQGREIKADDFKSELNYLKDRITKFKHQLMEDVSEKSEQLKNEIENILNKSQFEFTGTDISLAQSVKIKHGSGIKEKVFVHRESLLTELFKISHIKTFRHIFISVLIIICAQILIYDYTTFGKINLDFDLFWWSFKGFQITMIFYWLPMQLSGLFLVYYFFKLWALKRHQTKSVLMDGIFLSICIIYFLLMIIVPLYNIYSVSFACRVIILLEQVRILMKSYAFVRSNVTSILNHAIYNNKNDSDKPKRTGCPEFSKYLYFMFAPTLVYRNEYPRTKKVNWKMVICYFAEIGGVIIYTYCLFDRFCIPVFSKVVVKDLDFKAYLYLISISILPGALIQMMIFFSLLHSWHNAWAEMLRFGDRQFYLDWWNSCSFNTYYRTWNTLVQDWLYNYIYVDVNRLLGKKRKALSQFLVIFISSIFHEHILSFIFGFFYPVMFFLFSGFGFICLFIPRGNNAAWNVFVWISLFSGIGIQVCLFSIEWNAREQCPRYFDSVLDYFIPRSIMCSLY